MANRTKRTGRIRSKAHKAIVKAGKKSRARARSRGLHPASKKRRVRAARRMAKK